MSDLYNTRSAARLLGVSEASIRRWSDAGLLPVQRVGRRGTRRFAEADLLRFAVPGAGGVPVGPRVGPQVGVHDHLATFYDSDPARMRLSLPFLRAGLAAGDKCFLVGSAQVVEPYVEALAGAGSAPARRAAEGGALVTRSEVDSTARGAGAGRGRRWVAG